MVHTPVASYRLANPCEPCPKKPLNLNGISPVLIQLLTSKGTLPEIASENQSPVN